MLFPDIFKMTLAVVPEQQWILRNKFFGRSISRNNIKIPIIIIIKKCGSPATFSFHCSCKTALFGDVNKQPIPHVFIERSVIEIGDEDVDKSISINISNWCMHRACWFTFAVGCHTAGYSYLLIDSFFIFEKKI